MTNKLLKNASYSICLVPPLIFLAYYNVRPFADSLCTNSASIASLRTSQKQNIGLAASRINGFVLKPGMSFSFNNTVGPRVNDRGFVAAASYEGTGTGRTVGGGICLVSSLLYKSALEAGLSVVERKNHSRPIGSVEPGYDATVAYPRYDLKIANPTDEPVKFDLTSTGNEIRVEIRGRRKAGDIHLSRRFARSSDTLSVVVERTQDGRLTRISSDRYKLR